MKHVSIEEFVERVQTWSPQTEGGNSSIRYIDIGAVSQTEKAITEMQTVQAAEAPSRARQIVKAGDILVSTVRPNLNAVAVVPDDLDGATASTGFTVLRPDERNLSGNFLFHWVRSPAFINEMMKLATGQSYPAVSDKIVKASKIPLPALVEQRRIAGILDQADALRLMRSRALDRLNALGQAIFHEMFGDPRSNPKQIELVPLGKLIKVRSGDGLTSGKMRRGHYPVYGGNGITGWHDEGNVGEGTIIIGRVGVYCGSIHVTNDEAWVTDNALIVQKKVELETDYLASALKIANLNQYAGRSSQPLVSGSRIYPVHILFPSLARQREYSRKIFEVSRNQQWFGESQQNFQRLFSSLQDRAFRGEL